MYKFKTLLIVTLAVLAIFLVAYSQVSTSTQLLTGQQTAMAGAANLGNNVAKTVCLKALDGNTGLVYFGGSNVTTGNGMEMIKDQSYCVNVNNTNAIYIVGTGGGVSWVVSR